MPRLKSLLAALAVLIGACADTAPYDRFNERLRSLQNATERNLIAAMGRIPERSHELDARTRILQWRWDRSSFTPGIPPRYEMRSGQWVPVGGMPAELAQESCVVEWMIESGIATKYRWTGHGCRG